MAALTLSEAQKLDQNDLVAGVIESLVTRSPILEMEPFVTFTGDNLEFNRELTRGTASWKDPDESLVSEASTFTNVTVAMRYLYRDIDIPNPIQVGLSGKVDQAMVQIEEATLAMRDTYLDTFYYGKNSSNSKEPDGVHTLIDGITVPAGATLPRVRRGSGTSGAALRFQDFDNMLYTLMKRGVDIIIMHPGVYNLLQTATRATSVAGTVQYRPNEVGLMVPMYDGIRVGIDDAVNITETVASGAYDLAIGGSLTSVFFFRFGETTFHGAQQTPGFQVSDPFDLETKDSKRIRIKWYVVPAVLKSLYGAGKIDGVDDAVAVAA